MAKNPDPYAVTVGEIVFRWLWGAFLLAVIILAVCAP